VKLAAALAAAVILSGCATLASNEATIGCQAADTVTTIAALESGAREGNPLLARVLEGAGLPGLVLVKIAITWALLKYVRPERSELERTGRAAVNAQACAAAVYNLAVVLR
jgi:hypothetical protein